MPPLKIDEDLVSDTARVAEVQGDHFSRDSSDANYSTEFLSANRDTPPLDFSTLNAECYNVPFQLRELNLSLKKP